MDPETALELVQTNAFLLCLDVPQGTEFGLDMHMWTVGPKFKGIKMIPPGIHFMFYRQEGPMSQSFFFFFFFAAGCL